jgi:hypothetical protein
MHKVRGHYSSCTSRSSENICSRSSGGAQEKGKRGPKQAETKVYPLGCSCTFLQGFFLISPGFGTKLRVLVLGFPVFTENSIISIS